jgi:hypothetical protein
VALGFVLLRGSVLRPSLLPLGLLLPLRMDWSKLDFRPGLIFENDIRHRFASPVCPGSPDISSTFWLIISFGRCIFKLESTAVGHLLQAALGGFAKGFNVSQLADRVFCFSVSSKAVGFHIYNSKFIDRSEFRAFFNLWNHGGPNWKYEYRMFLQEKNANWWIVKGKKKISFANIVKLPPLSGANAIPIHRNRVHPRSAGNYDATRLSVFKRLGAPSTYCGPRNSFAAMNSGIQLNIPPRRISPLVSFSNHNGGMIRGDRHGRDVRQFSNSNSGLAKTRKLQWRPILRNVPSKSGPGPSATNFSEKAGSFGVGSPAFQCHFCKVQEHLELFCNFKKTEFGFPLSSFPSFEGSRILEGMTNFLDYSSWFRLTPGSLTDGSPPKFGCFEDFARAVLLKKYE